HLIESKVLWYQRIHGEHKHITTVWSDLPITRCLDVLSEINSNWDKFVHELSEEVLQRTITYKTMNGQPYQSTVHDILTHILNHSTYHRGQIAMEVRKAGGTPAQTDYITFCRE
ncbi:MAG TPA: DinB family protein, partial [bacterium]|nr:DinB family protein [bacterium]